MTWAISAEAAERFRRECRAAASDDTAFATFRSGEEMRRCVENQSLDEAIAWCRVIERLFPETLSVLANFLRWEHTGSPPLMHTWNGCCYSPTTWRYIRRTAELNRVFGDLSNMRIAEIGGGYGGLARIIKSRWPSCEYTIYDMGDVLQLQNRFLATAGVSVAFRDCHQSQSETYDLVISDFALCELSREGRDLYGENVLRHSSRGALTWPYLNDEAFLPRPSDVLAWLRTIRPDERITWGSELRLYEDMYLAASVDGTWGMDIGRQSFYWGASNLWAVSPAPSGL